MKELAVAIALGAPGDHWFGADKLKHFLVAAFTQSVSYSALQLARVRHDRAVVGAWTITTAVSIAKEVHDRRSTGLFSVKDLVWDAAGAGAATVLLERSRRSGGDGANEVAAIARRARTRVAWRPSGMP